jgi:hypothetical protein
MPYEVILLLLLLLPYWDEKGEEREG